MGLGRAEEQLAAAHPVGGLHREVLVGLARPRPAGRRRGGGPRRAGSSATGVVGDEPVRGRAQARREVVERGHRGLRVPELERADVRLRVAIARELLLGQARGEAGGADPAADRPGELTLIDDDATALLGVDGLPWRRSYVPVNSWSTICASICAKNVESGIPARASMTSSAGIEGTARPRSTAETNARVRGAPKAAWVRPRHTPLVGAAPRRARAATPAWSRRSGGGVRTGC